MKPHFFSKDAAERLSLAEVMDVAKGAGADLKRPLLIQLVKQQGALCWQVWQVAGPAPDKEA
jgi:hypothetical protein